MNCVFVINTRQYLCNNARDSILSACARWNADYHELCEESLSNYHPSFMKFSTALRLKFYSRVAYFDADMLIRSDAPSCFENFPDPARIYAVRDIELFREWVPQHLRSNFIQSVRAPYHRPLCDNLKCELNYQQYLDNFFNTGFFLCSPARHERLFEFLASHLPDSDTHYRGNAHYEQALFNYAVQLMTPNELEFVDETWNFIDPNLETRRMEKFVYHFTGAMLPRLRPQLKDFRWRL